MAVRSQPMESNPVARIAESIPAGLALAISIAGRLVGAAFALYYAYDQDTVFPGEHFPRTWALTVVIATIAIATSMPLRYRWDAFLMAFACGLLVFGGANLSHKGPGLVVLLAGAIAWVATAVFNHVRRESLAATVSGLFMASLATFLLVGAIVFTIEN